MDNIKPNGNQIIAEFISCSKKALDDKDYLEQILKEGIEKSGLNLVKITSHKFEPAGVTVVAIISESHISIHTYPEAEHASVDIFTCSPDMTKPNLLLNFLKQKLRPDTTKSYEITRGNPIQQCQKEWITGFSIVGFDVRYHVKKSLINKRSKYQQIDIIDNDNFGRMLFLDSDLQIAENDADIYNKAMVMPIVNSGVPLSRIAILGGGDGGVLHEMLQHNPGRVFMIDIDGEVIELSKKYLKNICKDAYENPKAEIIVDDANKFLETNGDFDAIIYDLTWHPEGFINVDRRIFLEEIFNKVRKSLKAGGVLTMQCCPEFDFDTLKLVEKILSKNFTGIKFEKVFIPSYCVNWIFASARAK